MDKKRFDLIKDKYVFLASWNFKPIKLLIIITVFLLYSSQIYAQRVIEWYGYGDDLSGDGGFVGCFFWGALLGICIQRLLEKKEGIDEGWLRTVLMSFWFVTPCSFCFILFVFY